MKPRGVARPHWVNNDGKHTIRCRNCARIGLILVQFGHDMAYQYRANTTKKSEVGWSVTSDYFGTDYTVQAALSVIWANVRCRPQLAVRSDFFCRFPWVGDHTPDSNPQTFNGALQQVTHWPASSWGAVSQHMKKVWHGNDFRIAGPLWGESIGYSMEYHVLTYCGLVTLYGDIDLVNIGSSNGLLPDGTKPLPEPMMTRHQQCPVAVIWWHYNRHGDTNR